MDVHVYARTLIRLKGQDLSLLNLLGARWIALKVLLVIAGIAGLLNTHIIAKHLGVFVLGYVFGVAIADIRRQLLAKRRWPFQQELYDWAKIESLAKAE